ncbi:hypothetical protein [Methanomassiliicoccus luminyensis]|uniref:hypothetical protein n=1 Tax=Methanomassiliicoccus luminyensis TaxID=1080712 RepID=UPI00037F074C|nr:hypothetical protein [Methanomassiliicoccus luminyensis]
MDGGKRPLGATALSALLMVFGIMGVLSGLALMISPSGALLGLPTEYLDRIPFHNYFLVGLFLFVIYGITPIALSYGLWTREQLFLGEISKAGGIHWAWQGTLVMLGILLVWLLVEHFIYDIELSPPTYFTVVLGVLMFILLMLPSVRRYCRSRTPA